MLVRLGTPFESYDNYEAMRMVFIAGVSLEDIDKVAQSDEIDDYMYEVLEKSARMVYTLNEAKVDQLANTTKYLKNAGVDEQSWLKVLGI